MPTPERPHIVLVMADSLGWGELGCYGGGALRGAPTPRIDRLAGEGLRLQNYNVESDGAATFAALMTGRHPARSGARQSVSSRLPQALPPGEITLAQQLSAVGYATALFGRWQLGDGPGCEPCDRGFDEWYGIPRGADESQYTSSIGYDPAVADLPTVMQGKRGEPSLNVKFYDVDSRRRIDAELVKKSIHFMARQHAAQRPFFLCVPLANLHFPTLPHPDFAGHTGEGDFADSMAETDHRVGQIVDAIDALGLAERTLFIFCSASGPEFRAPYRGTAGPWRGTHCTAMEGGLRAPCIARWPGTVPAGRVSNELVHVTDLFATLGAFGAAEAPSDRAIDGIDQRPFLLGRKEKSGREGFPFHIGSELRAVKWRDWKLHFFWEPEVNAGPGRLVSPYLFNLLRDPKEEVDIATFNTWVFHPVMRLVRDFEQSLLASALTTSGAAAAPATMGGRRQDTG